MSVFGYAPFGRVDLWSLREVPCQECRHLWRVFNEVDPGPPTGLQSGLAEVRRGDEPDIVARAGVSLAASHAGPQWQHIVARAGASLVMTKSYFREPAMLGRTG